MANNENEFRYKFLNSIPNDMHVVDIPDDAKRMLVLHPELAHLVVEKAYDFGLLYKGKYCAIELKNEDKSLTFNSSKIRAHQLRNLKQSVKCGGLGYVIVRFKKGLSSLARKKLKTTDWAIDKAYAIDVKWILRNKESSYTLEQLQRECIEVPFCIATGIYDVKVLWKTRNLKSSNTTQKR